MSRARSLAAVAPFGTVNDDRLEFTITTAVMRKASAEALEQFAVLHTRTTIQLPESHHGSEAQSELFAKAV